MDIDAGKTLLITLQAIHRNDGGDGHKLQFELNGQSRVMYLASRADAVSKGTKPGGKREIADSSNALHVGAPMPGEIVSVAVRAGQKVRRGSPLISLEAMKMETTVLAEADGEIERVLVTHGDRVLAKDLLVVLKLPMS